MPEYQPLHPAQAHEKAKYFLWPQQESFFFQREPGLKKHSTEILYLLILYPLLFNPCFTCDLRKVDGKQVKYYQVNLELIHMETHKKVWIGEKKIKKMVKQKKFWF